MGVGNILGNRAALLLTKEKVLIKLMWETSIVSEGQDGMGGRFGYSPGGDISE